jgi:hypothetical protein
VVGGDVDQWLVMFALNNAFNKGMLERQQVACPKLGHEYLNFSSLRGTGDCVSGYSVKYTGIAGAMGT